MLCFTTPSRVSPVEGAGALLQLINAVHDRRDGAKFEAALCSTVRGERLAKGQRLTPVQGVGGCRAEG
jgi:hypothetical protein